MTVSAEKQSPFARVTQNELAKEFFAMGMFSPARREEAVKCISMMEFEGKDALIRELTEGDASDGGAGDTPSRPGAPLTAAVAKAARRAAPGSAVV